MNHERVTIVTCVERVRDSTGSLGSGRAVNNEHVATVSCVVRFMIPQKMGITYSNARSSLTASSTSMILDPASSCMTSPEVTMGEMPSSMHVPLLEAMITRAQ